MNTIHRIHHLIGILAAGACALLAFAAASPALAETISVPHYGPPASVVPAQVPAQVHTVIAGGMPGWQITLIALAAALGAATVAVILDRARARARFNGGTGASGADARTAKAGGCAAVLVSRKVLAA